MSLNSFIIDCNNLANQLGVTPSSIGVYKNVTGTNADGDIVTRKLLLSYAEPPQPPVSLIQLWFNAANNRVYKSSNWKEQPSKWERVTEHSLLFTEEVVTDTGGGGGTTSNGIMYVHLQPSPSTVWIATHNLGSTDFIPAVFVDGMGLVLPDELNPLNTNQVQISFALPTTGKAVFAFSV